MRDNLPPLPQERSHHTTIAGEAIARGCYAARLPEAKAARMSGLSVSQVYEIYRECGLKGLERWA